MSEADHWTKSRCQCCGKTIEYPKVVCAECNSKQTETTDRRSQMDPNETLRRLRAGLSQLTPSDGDASWFKDNSAAIELIIESSVDLDDWLSKGGFYPEDWAHSSRATARQARLDGYADGSANN